MIKMQYGDKTHIEYLKREYLKIFSDMDNRRADWIALRDSLIARSVDFQNLLPPTLDEMLTNDFEALADIYESFVSLNLKKSDPLITNGKQLFNYSDDVTVNGIKRNKMQPVIASFFMNPANGFEIHTCHYCDMAYVNAYNINGDKKAQFDLDHVLDKGRCPIVGLSLFNFVPSCQMCNGSRIKGQKQLTTNPVLRKKLSPSNFSYDFEGKVNIEVHNKYGKCSTFGFEKRKDDYEIIFNTSKDPDYKVGIDFFHLTERYNYHKVEALRLMDLKERYTDARILELARVMLGNSSAEASVDAMKIVTQIKHDIFSTQFIHTFHRAFGKLHDDILK